MKCRDCSQPRSGIRHDCSTSISLLAYGAKISFAISKSPYKTIIEHAPQR
jgi:hypothetical protein